MKPKQKNYKKKQHKKTKKTKQKNKNGTFKASSMK